MGQRANGILYGCEAPEIPDDDGESIYELLMRWEKAHKITWESKGPHIHVENESDDGKTLIGVWVTVGGSGMDRYDDAPYFLERCMTLNEVSRIFRDRIAKVKKVWERFAAHVLKKEKIVLGEAALWLAPTETA